MSYLIEDDIIVDTKLTCSEKMVLSFIISQGECSDSLEVMRGQIGVGSLSTLRNTLKSLVSKGYLVVSNTGVNSPSIYSVANDQNTYSTSVRSDLASYTERKLNPKKALRNRRSVSREDLI